MGLANRRWGKRKMTNREWINQMSDEDLTDVQIFFIGIPHCITHHYADCKLQRLKEEHNEGEENDQTRTTDKRNEKGN